LKINLVSDLHLNWADIELPGGDVLIAAGDIMEAGHFRRADNAKKDTFLSDRYRRFIREEFAKYRHVIYIVGNHEHYGNSYEDTFERLKQEMPDNVHFLENSSVEIDGVHFFGGTFWTDMNRGDPMTIEIVGNGMNDFRLIKFDHGQKIDGTHGSYYVNKMHPLIAMQIFRDTVYNLKTFLDQHVNDPVVVVSHHAPSQLSIAEEFKNEHHMNGGYCSDLSEFIFNHPQIKAWCHGHMHNFSDYMIGTTRVMANPRGYKGHEQRAEEFDPGFSFEV